MSVQNQRAVYGKTLAELGASDTNIVVLEADLGKSTMSFLFGEQFPGRYFEMGIAEANMTSFAAGLASCGKTAFTNSFAVFSAGRSYDQIRQGICTAKLNVKIVGSSAGLSDFGDGATHQAIEDLAIMRALPNMTVLVPMDGEETAQITRAAASIRGPVYIRLSRNDVPDLMTAGERFELGKPRVIREGGDAVIFACGVMVSQALEAAETLAERGILVRVVNVSTLKPFNDEAVQNFARGMRAVVCAEEHSVVGGLTAAVTYALRGMNIKTDSVSVADAFGQSAHSYGDLLELYKLTSRDIAAKIAALMA